MCYSLFIEPAAEDDLNELWNSSSAKDKEAADLIAVTLEEIEADKDFLDRMFRRNETRIGSLSTADADQLQKFWWAGKNIHRLKIWDIPKKGGALLPWRVIYAYDSEYSAYYVLGIIRRETNYDEHDAKIQRILNDYDALGLPTY